MNKLKVSVCVLLIDDESDDSSCAAVFRSQVFPRLQMIAQIIVQFFENLHNSFSTTPKRKENRESVLVFVFVFVLL
jgi:hypothetical protein